MMGPFVVVFEWFLFDCVVSSRITYIPATPTLGWLHSLRCHRLSYGLLCGWWSTGGAIFFDLELLSNVFSAMFSNERDDFCVMCSLDPLDFWGIWNEDSIFHVSGAKLIQKTHPYFLGGDETLWSVACNSESHDQCQMHAFWATHFFLGFFLIYTGYKAGNTCGSWVTASCVGCEVFSNF